MIRSRDQLITESYIRLGARRSLATLLQTWKLTKSTIYSINQPHWVPPICQLARKPSPLLVVELDPSSRRSSLTRRRSLGHNKLREVARAESSAMHLHLDLEANMSARRAIGGGSDPFLSYHELSIPQYTNDLYWTSGIATNVFRGSRVILSMEYS